MLQYLPPTLLSFHLLICEVKEYDLMVLEILSDLKFSDTTRGVTCPAMPLSGSR